MDSNQGEMGFKKKLFICCIGILILKNVNFLKVRKVRLINFWKHRHEYPFFHQLFSLYMLVISFIVFVVGYFILQITETSGSLIIAPFGEELLKFSLLFLVIVFYTDYKISKDKRSKNLFKNNLLFFLLLLLVITGAEVFSPLNVHMSNILLLFIKQFCGHFAFTVVGSMYFAYFYSKALRKVLLVLFVITSLVISIILHSIANQMSWNVSMGAQLENLGVSQDIYISVLLIFSLILLMLFMKFKGKYNPILRETNDL